MNGQRISKKTTIQSGIRLFAGDGANLGVGRATRIELPAELRIEWLALVAIAIGIGCRIEYLSKTIPDIAGVFGY
jgi:hypothetical protein